MSVSDVGDPEGSPPGALRDLVSTASDAALTERGSADLARALLDRWGRAEPGPAVRLDAFGAMMPGHPGIRVELPVEEATAGGLAPFLAFELRHGSEDVIDNRFGRAFFRWSFATFPGGEVRDKVCVDLACGSQNPFAVSMLYVLLGARRALAVDLDPPQDERVAAWGVAEVASMMATDPRLLVDGWPVTRAEVARRLDGFDMVELWEGRLSGLDRDRIGFANVAADELPLSDGEADLVVSNSFLEHPADPEAVIAEIARVLRPGGWTWHLVDGHDHRIYTDPTASFLGFLAEPADLPLVHGCNRLRPLEFVPLFEAHGFESVAVYPLLSLPVDDEERATFVEPWRSMPDELLSVRGAVLSFRAPPT